MIAKRADAPYRHDRSGDWLKFKCANQQEFVIGGYTDPKGSRHGFGALLLGHYRGGDLVYAGKVGTGFDQELLEPALPPPIPTAAMQPILHIRGFALAVTLGVRPERPGWRSMRF